MTTRPYADCLALALAYCGIPDAAPEEVARIKAFLNKRARRAFGESDYWPRFYVVGEERIISEDELLPYSQDGKNTIKTCLRIHATQPFKQCGAIEYADFVAENDGFQVQGYCPREVSEGAPYEITNSTFFMLPDIRGEYEVVGYVTDLNGVRYDTLQSTSNTNFRITAAPLGVIGVENIPVIWYLGDTLSGNYWQSDAGAYPTPDTANGNYTATGAASGSPVVTKIPTYSAYVTYRAAFTVTYGDGPGETADVPEEWFDYMAYGTYADWLKSEGQQDKGAAADAEAYDQLVPHLEDLDRQSGSLVHTRVVNHANTQAR